MEQCLVRGSHPIKNMYLTNTLVKPQDSRPPNKTFPPNPLFLKNIYIYLKKNHKEVFFDLVVHENFLISIKRKLKGKSIGFFFFFSCIHGFFFSLFPRQFQKTKHARLN